MEPRNQRLHLGREPRRTKGLRTPLFDRLRDGAPDSGVGISARRVYDREAVLESVRNEVGRILNTRAHLRNFSAQLAEGTVLDYGLPDFSARTAASEADLAELAGIIARKVAQGEPRLVNIRVLLKPDPSSPRSVIGVIRASLKIGEVVEPVTFPLQVEGGMRPTIPDAGRG